MNVNNVKLILFDIDNTLAFGPKASTFYRAYSSALEETLAKSLIISVSDAKKIADEHRLKFDGQGEKAFELLLGDISPWYDAILTINPRRYLEKQRFVNTLLRTLKSRGYLLGAITDGPTRQGESILRTVGIDKKFFNLFLGWEAGFDRPKGGKPTVFIKIAELYNLKPDQIVMVGDTLGLDILPAVDAGLNAIHVSSSPVPSDKWGSVESVLDLKHIFIKEQK